MRAARPQADTRSAPLLPTRRHFSPTTIRAPFGRYHQAVHVEGGSELLVLSGLLGVLSDDTMPDGVAAQASVIFNGIDACLKEAGMAREHIVRLTTYLVDIADRAAAMAVRDAWVKDPPPASTLLVVKALALPTARIEIEALAARG